MKVIVNHNAKSGLKWGIFRKRIGNPSVSEEQKTLKQCAVGEHCTVLKINGSGALRKRLMEMGITKGVKIYINKIAPLGDPIEITVRGYELSLRKSEAESIVVV